MKKDSRETLRSNGTLGSGLTHRAYWTLLIEGLKGKWLSSYEPTVGKWHLVWLSNPNLAARGQKCQTVTLEADLSRVSATLALYTFGSGVQHAKRNPRIVHDWIQVMGK